jgi:methanogenic corrinoid protein MtbC1
MFYTLPDRFIYEQSTYILKGVEKMTMQEWRGRKKDYFGEWTYASITVYPTLQIITTGFNAGMQKVATDAEAQKIFEEYVSTAKRFGGYEEY